MDEIREALRDGLREEAMPIGRRLAEVKGLSNNAIRRLAGIEATIEAERNARLDDVTLLIDLLTEGWRAELKGGAAPHLGAQLDPTAERGGELLGDRQPEPRAAAGLRNERPEQALALLGRDAGTRVLDRDVHRSVSLRELEGDGAAVGRRLERVRDQVPDDLQHAVAVGDDHRPVVRLALVVDAATTG